MNNCNTKYNLIFFSATKIWWLEFVHREGIVLGKFSLGGQMRLTCSRWHLNESSLAHSDPDTLTWRQWGSVMRYTYL